MEEKESGANSIGGTGRTEKNRVGFPKPTSSSDYRRGSKHLGRGGSGAGAGICCPLISVL